MKKRRAYLLLAGGLMLLIGAFLLGIASIRRIELVVDGGMRTVTSISGRVSSILRTAGTTVGTMDRVRPGLNESVGNGGRISVDHALPVSLSIGEDSVPLDFVTYQRFGGNILLDAGVRLYPGDQLLWNETVVQPDFNLSGSGLLSLRLRRADSFTLVTEAYPMGRTVHGSGKTVLDALMSADVRPNRSQQVFPGEDSPFEKGMTIEVLPIRELIVSYNGQLIRSAAAAVTVGDALARIGLPLQGWDVSIPAASEPLPADGRILIVPVAEDFSMNAETIRRETEWQANDTLELDETRLVSEGRDGLKGTFTRKRWENGTLVLDRTSEENELVSAVSDKREYGTKINIRTLDTPDGPVEYYRAVKVYANSYSPCRSGTANCITGTASGAKVSKGVIAVTSSWYRRLGGQSVYVPDYGKAVIADVGGGIPGRHWIDLAYDDDNFVSWSKETTLYFLTPVPADMVWILQ